MYRLIQQPMIITNYNLVLFMIENFAKSIVKTDYPTVTTNIHYYYFKKLNFLKYFTDFLTLFKLNL